MRVVLAASLISSVIVSTAVAATPCGDLTPVGGSTGYRHRSGPDRCEGLYQAAIAGESVELLSFVRRPIAFDAKTKALMISAPGTQALSGKEVVVIARALPAGTYYRMDAQVPSAGSLTWPIADVVIPAGLASSDVGVVGYVKGRDEDVYVPLDVGAGAPKPDTAMLLATFRAATDLESFKWRVYDPSSALPTWQSAAPGRQVSRGDPIVISPSGPSGSVLTLEVAAKPVGGSPIRAKFKILLP
jgi:hypothetical protein